MRNRGKVNLIVITHILVGEISRHGGKNNHCHTDADSEIFGDIACITGFRSQLKQSVSIFLSHLTNGKAITEFFKNKIIHGAFGNDTLVRNVNKSRMNCSVIGGNIHNLRHALLCSRCIKCINSEFGNNGAYKRHGGESRNAPQNDGERTKQCAVILIGSCKRVCSEGVACQRHAALFINSTVNIGINGSGRNLADIVVFIFIAVRCGNRKKLAEGYKFKPRSLSFGKRGNQRIENGDIILNICAVLHKEIEQGTVLIFRIVQEFIKRNLG